MARLETTVINFVKPYQNSKGSFWKICVPDGRGGQIRRQGFPAKTIALKEASKLYLRSLIQAKRIDIADQCITFADYAELWLEQKIRGGVADNTERRYRDLVNQFLVPFFGNIKLQELEKNHLKSYIRDSQEKDASTYNVNSTVTIFKMIIKQAIEDDYLEMNGILMVRTPKHYPKDPNFWDYSEMTFFLNAAKNSKWFDLYKLVLLTGLRAGEAAALKWDAINLDRKSGDHVGFIHVHRTCAQKTLKIRETTKNRESRVIPIFPELRALLLERKTKIEGEFVFGGKSPVCPSHFSRKLRKDLQKIPELKPISFHGLRHTFCSYLDSTGMNRRIVSEIMGHRDLSTTNRYSHVSNQVLGSEVSRWVEEQNQQNSSNFLKVVV